MKRKDNPMNKKEAIDYCINLAKHANENDIVVSISVQKEEDLSAPISIDLSAIEVESKGKKEEAPDAE